MIGTKDQIITPESELAMAHRAHSHILEVPGGSHLTLILHPAAVTKQIRLSSAVTVLSSDDPVRVFEQFAHVDLLVRSFGSLQGVLAASASDLQSVDGIGSMWARHIREGLSQLAESTIADQLA